MRYDGVARRSQKANPSGLDHVWNFFSSVKIAIYLILITLIAASLGTIYPQEDMFVGQVDFAKYYKDTYGWTGQVYHAIGLSNTYGSWWFKALLVMIGASLVICSLDRILPLYRALSKKAVRKHPTFLLRQNVRYQQEVPEDEKKTEATLQKLSQTLAKQHYRVSQEGTALFAEKYRFSRWGPYINHIGLIIFLVACLVRSMFAWNLEYFSVEEGTMKQITGTGYYLKNEKFDVKRYADGMTVKSYITRAKLYACVENCDSPGKEKLKEVKAATIRVNHPLKYRDLQVFNVDYQQTPMIIGANVHITDATTNKELSQFKIDLMDPASSYKAGPYTLDVLGYFAEAKLEDGKFITTSAKPKAPVFVFNIKGPQLPESGQVYLYFVRPIDKVKYGQDLINAKAGSTVKLGIGSMSDVTLSQYTTYFNVTRDRTMPFIWIGAGISMFGLILGFYWHHRRVWVQIESGRLLLGAHTNKNWYGLRKEVARALHQAGILDEADDEKLKNEVEKS
jgi:cytochrome c biogenesis protein